MKPTRFCSNLPMAIAPSHRTPRRLAFVSVCTRGSGITVYDYADFGEALLGWRRPLFICTPAPSTKGHNDPLYIRIVHAMASLWCRRGTRRGGWRSGASAPTWRWTTEGNASTRRAAPPHGQAGFCSGAATRASTASCSTRGVRVMGYRLYDSFGAAWADPEVGGARMLPHQWVRDVATRDDHH